ncbi:MAG: AAA family ATPase [Candidatus Cryptobacteroides sp.]
MKRYPSQNKAVNSLKGTSAGTVSSIINGKWENISEDMWLNISSQIGTNSEWQICRTTAYNNLMFYMNDAKSESSVMWVVGPAGIGKSTAATSFASENQNVFRITCSEDMHKSDFIHELAALIGVRTVGMTVREGLAAIIDELVRMERPLLIFDEGDKLTDSVLYYYISLYNALEDKCGMIFFSTAYIKERMRKGLSRAKKGYDELDSRICRNFISLDYIGNDEVAQICHANGLDDSKAVARVMKDASSCGNDLRRVKRLVHRELKKLCL